jgi:epoxyqueuosine reductase
MKVSRRSLMKLGAALGAGLAAAKAPGLSWPTETHAKTLEQPPYTLTNASGRFEQKNTMFCRVFWDKDYAGRRRALKQRNVDLAGELDAVALNFAGWWRHNVESPFCAFGVSAAPPLMRWDDKVVEMTPQSAELYSRTRFEPTDTPMIWSDQPAKFRYEAPPEVLARKVKNAGIFLGASEIGITKLNPTWVYERFFDFAKKESKPWPKDPAQFKYAVAIAIEMDYQSQRDITSYYASGSTGLGYSKMVEVASSLAKFIRTLGYPAIPIGNDTCNNVPIAVDAGLGEVGRHGLLITPRFGPRVRLASVLTDLPMAPDKPIEFGVRELCKTCMKCAELCPNKAISLDGPTDKPRGAFNRQGVLRWPVDAEKCFDFWHINRSACNTCVSVCPYNKRADVWFHHVAPKIVDSADSSTLDSLLVKLDNVLGYGARKRYKL